MANINILLSTGTDKRRGKGHCDCGLLRNCAHMIPNPHILHLRYTQGQGLYETSARFLQRAAVLALKALY